MYFLKYIVCDIHFSSIFMLYTCILTVYQAKIHACFVSSLVSILKSSFILLILTNRLKSKLKLVIIN